MSRTSPFQVYCISNGSTSKYPSNNPQKFTNTFAEPFDLNGAWEVSLIDIFYPLNVSTVIPPTPLIIPYIYRIDSPLLDIAPDITEEDSQIYTRLLETTIPELHPYNTEQLGRQIAKSLSYKPERLTIRNNSEAIRVTYNFDYIKNRGYFTANRRCAFYFPKTKDTKSLFEKRLGIPLEEFVHILDTNDAELVSDTVYYKSDSAMEYEVDKTPRPVRQLTPRNLYKLVITDSDPKTSTAPTQFEWSKLSIYTNLIYEQEVNDDRKPLLELIPYLNPTTGFTNYYKCDPQNFYPLRNNYISEITIELKLDNQDITNIDGLVIARLEF